LSLEKREERSLRILNHGESSRLFYLRCGNHDGATALLQLLKRRVQLSYQEIEQPVGWRAVEILNRWNTTNEFAAINDVEIARMNLAWWKFSSEQGPIKGLRSGLIPSR